VGGNAAGSAELTADEVRELNNAAARIEIQGGRYPEQLERMTNLWCGPVCFEARRPGSALSWSAGRIVGKAAFTDQRRNRFRGLRYRPGPTTSRVMNGKLRNAIEL
jgi:hypothetical protein